MGCVSGRLARSCVRLLLFAGWVGLSGCGGDDGSSGSLGGSGTLGGAANRVCSGDCPQEALTIRQVKDILAQGVAESEAQGVAATLAVVDHVGNVLAVFEMDGAATSITITSGRGVETGLDDVDLGLLDPLPSAALSAISKAGTAAFLSTQGNAFTTRTAGQIVQQNFNPGENGQPGGPLFGVQFSQLPCNDFSRRFDRDGLLGPKRMPLGLSADPGGLPLYINGVPVGGVGVELAIDGSGAIYTFDPDLRGVDDSPEESIAAAASAGFEAPSDRRANRIAVLGRFLRYADDLAFLSQPTPDFDVEVAERAGSLVAVPGFYAPEMCPMPAEAPGVCAGVQFHTPASGIVPVEFEGIPAEILVDAAGTPEYPPTASSIPDGMTAEEVRVLLREALAIAQRSRAQIRRPAGSVAKVTIHVVDTTGAILGSVRGRDAPIFGIDVSLQKARTAAFFSSPHAAEALRAAGFGGGPENVECLDLQTLAFSECEDYVDAMRRFVADPTALANGIAFADRSGGNLSRPFFPDGVNGNVNGPLSRPFAEWSPFSTGLQLDAVLTTGLVPILQGRSRDTCTAPSLSALSNGIQIFPGSVPIYRGEVLVGGIGVSGDGVDQDDMIAFLGLHNAGLALDGALQNAPRENRADTIAVGGIHLRYVSCPPSPFIGSSEQNVCTGK